MCIKHMACACNSKNYILTHDNFTHWHCLTLGLVLLFRGTSSSGSRGLLRMSVTYLYFIPSFRNQLQHYCRHQRKRLLGHGNLYARPKQPKLLWRLIMRCYCSKIPRRTGLFGILPNVIGNWSHPNTMGSCILKVLVRFRNIIPLFLL